MKDFDATGKEAVIDIHEWANGAVGFTLEVDGKAVAAGKSGHKLSALAWANGAESVRWTGAASLEDFKRGFL